MKAALTVFLSIVTLGVIGAGGYLAYQYGYSAGEGEGYETGYSTGQEIGYQTGSEEGYAEGYEIGEDTGYESGYDTGFDSGLEDGYDSGYLTGKETGYKTGFLEGRSTGLDIGYESGYTVGVEDGIGHGYTLKDPTYAEALAFMQADKTDENDYVDNGDGTGYVCSHFSCDTGNNAEAVGYRCALVEIRHVDSGHEIIAFNTVDRGMVYFEPQHDLLVELELGKRYYQCVIPPPGTYYVEPDYDDTIMDILIHW